MAAEEDTTLCLVCQKIYRDPRVFGCGHSFCLECIKGVANNRRKFPCPVCRFSVDVRDGNIDQLPKNVVLCNVIEANNNTLHSMCLKHKKLLDIFCERCDMVICSKCLSMQHKGHVIEDTDKVFIERTKKLTEYLAITKLWASMIQEKRYVVEQSRKSMQKNADSIHKTADQLFKKWFDALHTQQNTFLSYLHRERHNKMQVYDEAESVLMSSMTNVTKLETEINKIMSNHKAFVIQQYGSIKVRQESTRDKVLFDITTSFTPPEDLKIEVCAPWIEEAIENINPIDMMQAKIRTQKISEIQNINIILKRQCEKLRKRHEDLKEKDMEQLKYENKFLKYLLSHLHKYVTSHANAKSSTFEKPGTIKLDSPVATQYQQAQDIYNNFKEMQRIQNSVLDLESAYTVNKQLRSHCCEELQNTNDRIRQRKEKLQKSVQYMDQCLSREKERVSDLQKKCVFLFVITALLLFFWIYRLF